MRAERQSLDYSDGMDPKIGRWPARLSLLGGGIAWFLHLFISYIIGEFGCLSGWGSWIIGGLSMVAWLLIGTTVLTCIVAATAVLSSVKAGKRLEFAKGDAAVISAENGSFIARTSIITNGIFFFIILVQAIPIFFYLQEC